MQRTTEIAPGPVAPSQALGALGPLVGRVLRSAGWLALLLMLLLASPGVRVHRVGSHAPGPQVEAGP